MERIQGEEYREWSKPHKYIRQITDDVNCRRQGVRTEWEAVNQSAKWQREKKKCLSIADITNKFKIILLCLILRINMFKIISISDIVNKFKIIYVP